MNNKPIKFFIICLSFMVIRISGASPILFSPYKDVTVSFNSNNNIISTRVNTPSSQSLPSPLLSIIDQSVTTVTWGFATGECGQEQWGWFQPSITDTFATTNIESFINAGKKYIIATGGAAGAFTCNSESGIENFVKRYNSPNLAGLDFDIEGNLSYPYNPTLVWQLINSIAHLHNVYPNLKISFTLGTNAGSTLYPGESQPFGVSDLGALVLNDLAFLPESRQFPFTVNLMVMDYQFPQAKATHLLSDICVVSSSDITSCDMGKSAIQAAKNLNTYYKIPFNQIELTPMIGKNDVQTQIFTESDVTTITTFAKANQLAGLHVWSFDRDTSCDVPPGSHASPTCSQVDQESMAYQKDFTRELAQ